MEKMAERFLATVLRISNDEKGNIGIEFRDGSVIEYNIDSCRYRLLTSPMTPQNRSSHGTIG